MATPVPPPVDPPPGEKKRVKVYELKNNDWFDRGTGFCMGQTGEDVYRIVVESEDQPDRLLLETTISKDDGYQKQQDTLIVWTEKNGTDMALSFQEAEGCAAIWDFVSRVRTYLTAIHGPDDTLSDDMDQQFQPQQQVALPVPELGNLESVEGTIKGASLSPQGRDLLAKCILAEDYIRKLVPLVGVAEDLHGLDELHFLSNIMKMLILLNDTQIIDTVVSDSAVMGVVGALEYDSEFPNHKANHRRYLQDQSRFKEVVPIKDETIKVKIHATWRLQYLKDVVLARILDDPTFSVLNSLIFFNQVDIVNHLQANNEFLTDLFKVIDDPSTNTARRKDAISFLQQCCAIAKNLQAPQRVTLYNNFIQNGLLNVITFAVSEREAAIRVAGTDILVAMIDHDPALVRSHCFRALNERRPPLTETLIDLLLSETDFGVKAQAADAIKVLLDPNIPQAPQAQGQGQGQGHKMNVSPTSQQAESFITTFYDVGAERLFEPLVALKEQRDLKDLSMQQVVLYSHLIEILTFFLRWHGGRSQDLISSLDLFARVRQLLSVRQKHMRLTALKIFRACLAFRSPQTGPEHQVDHTLNFFIKQMIKHEAFGPILDIVEQTMPRDNLLNSACLELFDCIGRDSPAMAMVLCHIVDKYRERLKNITYVKIFQHLLLIHAQSLNSFEVGLVQSRTFPIDETNGIPSRPVRQVKSNGPAMSATTQVDASDEENWAWSGSDDDDDDLERPLELQTNGSVGASPLMKPLVDYPDDDEEDEGQVRTRRPHHTDPRLSQSFYGSLSSETSPSQDRRRVRADARSSTPLSQHPPDRIPEKRKFEEDDDDDELGKLSSTNKRRNSSSSITSVNSTASLHNNASERSNHSSGSGGSPSLRKKKSMIPTRERPGTAKKIEINMGRSGIIKRHEVEEDTERGG